MDFEYRRPSGQRGLLLSVPTSISCCSRRMSASTTVPRSTSTEISARTVTTCLLAIHAARSASCTVRRISEFIFPLHLENCSSSFFPLPSDTGLVYSGQVLGMLCLWWYINESGQRAFYVALIGAYFACMEACAAHAAHGNLNDSLHQQLLWSCCNALCRRAREDLCRSDRDDLKTCTHGAKMSSVLYHTPACT